MDEQTKERLRMELEDAVVRALEAGMTETEVRTEVDYAIESFDA